jgi:hypothetical protein
MITCALAAGVSTALRAKGDNRTAWPYAPAMDAPVAAPKNHIVRFLEVVIRPGETEYMHGHPYPSVFAYYNHTAVSDATYRVN